MIVSRNCVQLRVLFLMRILPTCTLIHACDFSFRIIHVRFHAGYSRNYLKLKMRLLPYQYTYSYIAHTCVEKLHYPLPLGTFLPSFTPYFFSLPSFPLDPTLN